MLESILNFKSEAWIGVIGVLLGTLLSVFSAWLTNRSSLMQLKVKFKHEEKLSAGKVRKERLEELYILVCHWSNMFFSQYMNLGLVMRGHISYNDYLDMVNSSENKYDYSRIEMIVDIYGGGVAEAFKAVEIARGVVNDVSARHKSAYKRGESGEGFVDPANEAQLLIGDALDAMKRAIAREARA